MVDAAFDVCSKSLCSTFEKTDRCVCVWCLSPFIHTIPFIQRCLTNVLSSNMTNQQLLLDLGKFDFLIKQKTDQMVFLFTDLAPGAAAVSKLTDENARRLWTSKFGKGRDGNSCFMHAHTNHHHKYHHAHPTPTPYPRSKCLSSSLERVCDAFCQRQW